ncbi:MAG: aminotransferase class V-fold PLP-dependent enzyme, partial [Pseudomonadales bacterium]
IVAGADLVTFSGDKLLGGPQSGLIVGRRDLIEAVNRNPLKRALRCDKMTLAALASLLRMYMKPETLASQVPTLQHLARPVEDIASMVERLVPEVNESISKLASVTQVDCQSQIGSGALPVDTLASKGIAIRPLDGREATLQQIASALKALPIPVLGRLHDGALILDCRTLTDDSAFLDNLRSLTLP